MSKHVRARQRLVPSKTRLLGLPATVDDSYDLDPGDTIAMIREQHERVCRASEIAVADLSWDTVLTLTPGSSK